MYKNQKGFVQILAVVILLAGILGGLYLVQHPQIFKPKALETNQSSPRYKIGAYYFGIFSPNNTNSTLLEGAQRVYGRRDLWAGVKDFYGLEPGVPKDTRGWRGDFSHLKPEIGYYDQSDGTTLERHITQAKQNGLSFFNFYWYWDSNRKREIYNDGLDSFLNASNRNELEFMISITSHPWGDGDIRLSIPAEDMPTTTQTIVDKYFAQPNYLKTQSGKPIVFILDPRGIKNGTLQDTKDFITLLKQKTKDRLGVEPFVLVSVENPDARSVSNADGYSCVATDITQGVHSYQNYINNFVSRHFTSFTDKPVMPCFVSNFDERPRQDIAISNRDEIRYFNDFSEALFRQGLTRVKQYMGSQSSELGKILTIYAWNEWHEGGIIEPNVRDGNKWISIIRDVFGLASLPEGEQLPVYRLVNNVGDYFYTISESEKNGAIATYGYTYQGIVFKAYVEGGNNLVPVYRLVNNIEHFYTINENELNHAKSIGYKEEGIAFYVLSNPINDSLDVYRLVNGDGYHFYTANLEEKERAITNHGYTYQGIAFYVPAAP